MNTYDAFYRNRSIKGIQANTTYAAQQAAAKLFGVKPAKTYEVTVVLVALAGSDTPVTHAPLF